MPITVTVLDTGGIQPFIFGSNVLRENIGASELVHRATRLWAFEALDDLEKERHNIDVDAAKEDRIRKMYTGKFEADGTDAIGSEVLYAGGGNTVILFQGDQHLKRARDFVYKLSLRVLEEAPGLNLYAAHEAYEWGQAGTSLPAVVDQTLKKLAALKGKAGQSRPALGFPVTAACTSTGLPANGTHPDTKGKTGSARRANRQVDAKWTMALDTETNDDARARLRRLAPAVGRFKEFDWADEFDDLADLPDRDDSYIAIVHADGNGMGKRIMALTAFWKEDANAGNPRGYIEKMRGLSIKVQETAQDALKNTLKGVLDHLTDHGSLGPTRHATKVEYKQINGKRVPVSSQKLFPIRPLVFGGDDVTLVCAGPWGLAIAQRYLAELERQTLTEGETDPPFACAGIAIVKTHYPFSQAYDLSEKLLKSAKDRSKKLAQKEASAIDWHLSTTGLHGDLKSIRNREYKYGEWCLTMRPLMIHKQHLTGAENQWSTWRNWSNLTGLLDVFGEGGDWQVRRNKTIRLREALRRGPDAVAEFLTIFGENEANILSYAQFEPSGAVKNGWVDDGEDCDDKDKHKHPRCAYFDAIEIAEQFYELPGKEDGA